MTYEQKLAQIEQQAEQRRKKIQRTNEEIYNTRKSKEEQKQANMTDYERKRQEKEKKSRVVDLQERIANYLTREHSDSLRGSMLDESVRQTLKALIHNFITEEKIVLPGFETAEDLAAHMLIEIVGLGPIEELIQREEGRISEIWVNGVNPITGKVEFYYEKGGKKYKEKEIKFRDQQHAQSIAEKIARNGSQPFGTATPLANVRYPGGRVNLVRSPIAPDGPYISLRLFPKDTITPEDLLKSGSMNEEMYLFIKTAVKYGLNTLIVGPTGSGKTTLLTASCGFISPDDRILTMEDTEEMRIQYKYPHLHIIAEECKFNTQDALRNYDLSRLTINALRQKPDYMIYGEVRDKAAYDMLNGANTGHKVLSTLHSRSAAKAVQRLINMVLEHGSKMSTDAIGKWIAESIDIIIFQKLYADKKRRVKEIIELTGYENGEPTFTHLFKYVIKGKKEDGTFDGKHYRTGKISEGITEMLIDEGADMKDVAVFLQDPEQVPYKDWQVDIKPSRDLKNQEGGKPQKPHGHLPAGQQKHKNFSGEKDVRYK